MQKIAKTNKFQSVILLFLSLAASHTASAEQRIITAGANVTELVIALEKSDNIVGIDMTSRSLLPQIESTTPPEILGVHRALSSESILAITPDILIGTNEMGPNSTLEQLAQTGLNVAILSPKTGIEGLKQRIEEVSQLTHSTKQAEALLNKIQQQEERINESHQEINKNNIKAIYLMSFDGKRISAAGDNTVLSELFSLVGLNNVTVGQFNSYKPIASEALIAMNPQMVVVSQHTLMKLGGLEGLKQSIPVLAMTEAGRNEQFVIIEGRALIGGLGLESLNMAEKLSQAALKIQSNESM